MKANISRSMAFLAAVAWLLSGPPARAQDDPFLPSHDVPLGIDSGWVQHDGIGDGPEVVFTADVSAPEATWLRLAFSQVHLAGNIFAPDHSYLLITSVEDGAVQQMNQLDVVQWSGTSAYFNGDAVRVDLISFPGSGPSRVVIPLVTAGEPGGATRSICGGVDDRVLSDDPRSGRYLPAGCSAWLIDRGDNCFLCAGHCGISGGGVVEFNVPLSSSTGSLRHPPPEDQYAVDPASVQATSGGLGNDWAFFGCFNNSTTGMSPRVAQGAAYTLASTVPPVAGQTIDITGYGTVSFPVSRTWNQVQKRHEGPYVLRSGTVIRYQVDTSGGNSGSAVLNLDTGEAIGIHTNAGCDAVGGNQGTAIDNPGLQNALADPQGVCGDGSIDVLVPPVFIAADSRFRFGSLDSTTGEFARGVVIGESVQGLAFDRNDQVFYASGASSRSLIRIPVTGDSIQIIGTITGTSAVMSGMAYDPVSRTLLAINAATGQLYEINTSTAVATEIGSPGGGRVPALAIDPASGQLYALGNPLLMNAVLLRIDRQTGDQTVVGPLGSGIAGLDGLGFNPADGMLYTYHDSARRMLRIDPATGAATVVGDTGVAVGSSWGMACSQDAPACAADLDGDGDVDVSDFFAFVAAFASMDPAADIDGDGDVDVGDFFAFVVLFAAGCP